MALTCSLGRFVVDLSPNRVPDEAVRIARTGFIDCIGTMIAGRAEPCTQILKDVLAPGNGPATLYFSGEQSPGVDEHPVTPEDVRKVSVHLSSFTSDVLVSRQPDTALAAKFSMEFLMASALVAHRVSLAELTDPFVQSKDVQDTMRLVERDLTDESDERNPGLAPWDQVKIELVSGQVLESEQVTRARGHADRPLTDSQLHEKFEDCLASGRSKIPAHVLFERLQSMPSISARELTAQSLS